MLSLPNSAHAIADFSAPSYQMLMQEKLRQKWDDLGRCTVKQMVDEWLTFLKPITSGTYGKLFRYMYEKGFVNPNHTLQQKMAWPCRRYETDKSRLLYLVH
jgi:hypothetical protein